MRIEPIHVWMWIERGLGWNIVGRGLCHVLHNVNLCGSIASDWDTEETKAPDVQSQLDGVVRNKAIHMKVSAGMAKPGSDRNNTVHGYFNSCLYSH